MYFAVTCTRYIKVDEFKKSFIVFCFSGPMKMQIFKKRKNKTHFV